jgi:hypothetical protein
MAIFQEKTFFKAVEPIASANSTVLVVAAELLNRAKETQDEVQKQKLLNAAQELIKASDTISESLERAAKA